MTNPAASALRAATTSFNVLGPVTVEHSGVSAPLGGPRQVAVLARLLIGVGQVVTMDQLVEAVWDGAGPSQPEVTIRSYLSNLRRAIEPERSRGGRNSCIESCSPGYRLAVDPIRIDAHRFEAEVERGRAALAAGDGDTCVDLLERALDRWRGGPYDGVLETAAVVGVRARLEERRLVAVESLAEARLARGEHEAVMPLLEAGGAALDARVAPAPGAFGLDGPSQIREVA
ncbi:MAG: BTAD domain-containing putative transcriptional regulator, partial [Actinomycetota bacterium]